MRKFLTAMMMLTMFFGTSYADIIYTTSDGVLGSIAVNTSLDLKAPSTHYRSGINTPLLANFWDGDGTEVFLVDPYKTDSGDRAYVFSSLSLSSPIASEDIEGVFGAYLSDYARNGRSLFMAAGSKLYEVDTEYFDVVNSFDCRKILSSDKHNTEIVSVLVDYNFINAIIGCGDARKFVRFDGQLEQGVKYFLSADVSADASCIFEQNGITLIGCQPGIRALNNAGKFVSYLSKDKSVTDICADDDGQFYYATKTTTDDGYRFLVTNVQNSALKTKFSSREIFSSYPYIKLLRETNRNILVIMTAEAISLYDMKTARHLRDYSASELGGRPVGMVMSTAPGYEDSSSSGCSVQTGMLLLLLTAGFALWKKKTL